MYTSPKGNTYSSKQEYITSVIEYLMNNDQASQKNGYYFITKPLAFFNKLDISIEELYSIEQLVDCSITSTPETVTIKFE